ncbi:hypothetical protein BsWGS_22997 [Bradybaena similaris]
MNDKRLHHSPSTTSADSSRFPSSILVDDTSSHSSSSSSASPSLQSASASGSPLTPPPTPPTVFSPCQVIFREAVQNGDTTELQRILEEREGKINVNLFDKEGQTALHHSCFKGNLELVKLLVRFGADVRLANRDGWNPLHIAAYGGHNDIFLFLMTVPSRRS